MKSKIDWVVLIALCGMSFMIQDEVSDVSSNNYFCVDTVIPTDISKLQTLGNSRTERQD